MRKLAVDFYFKVNGFKELGKLLNSFIQPNSKIIRLVAKGKYFLTHVKIENKIITILFEV